MDNVKKGMAFLLAAVLALGCIWGSSKALDARIFRLKDNLIYNTGLEKYNCPDAFDDILNESSVLLLGSSELSLGEENTHPQIVFNNGNGDFQTVVMGAPNNQSLSHAIHLGALAGKCESNKVVLILSPQWFTAEGVSSGAFSSRFYPQMFDGFMKNKKISDRTKKKIVKRCKTLLEKDPKQKKRVELYEKIYLTGDIDPLDYLYLNLTEQFLNLQSKYNVVKTQRNPKLSRESWYNPRALALPTAAERVKTSEIDFQALLESAEEEGKQSCTNNPFYISDTFFNKMSKVRDAGIRTSNRNLTSSDSPEYGDLELFLQVCRETGIEVMLVSVPVNGYWYDYTGSSKTDREAYYQNIRNIAEQNGVRLVDYSDREYEPYFLRDIMHLGWKGWAYLDEQIYQFYQAD